MANFPEEKSEKKSENAPKKETKTKTIKYSVPTMAEIRKASKSAIAHDILSWQNKIAKDKSFHYVRYSNDKRTHSCPICNPKTHPVGPYHGGNCIWAAFASWRHGGKIKSKCSCHVINNNQYDKMLKADSDESALKMVRDCVGIKDVKVIRNHGKAIPLSKIKAADILVLYDSNNKYYHTASSQGGDLYFDCTSGRSDNIKSENKMNSYMKKHIKMVIRYTGTRDYISIGAKGSAVKKIQKIVGVTVDGVYGTKTRAAVKKWQKAHGVSQTGKVGAVTLAKMKAVMK